MFSHSYFAPGVFKEVGNREMFFEYVAFWTGCRVWADLVGVHSRRPESGKVFPRGRILGGVVTGSRNPGRYTPEIRIRVWDLEKRPNLDLSLIINYGVVVWAIPEHQLASTNRHPG